MKKCKYCENEFINLGNHEYRCSMNPEVIKKNEKDALLNLGATKEQPILREPVPQEQEAPQSQIIIDDVQPFGSDEDLFAWFVSQEGKVKRKAEHMGIIHNNRNESIPCLLLITNDGMLLPPFMMEGFIGMFPEYQEFPELEQEIIPSQKEETKPPIAEIANESIKAPLHDRIIIPPPKIEAQPQKKKGFLGLFQKKEKIMDTPKISKETNDLLNEIMNVSQ